VASREGLRRRSAPVGIVLQLRDHRSAIRTEDLLEACGSGDEALPEAAPLRQSGRPIALSLGPKVREM
jgi:hypothetical protein